MYGRKNTETQRTSDDEARQTPSKLVRSQGTLSQRKQIFAVEEQVNNLNDRIQKLQIKVESQKKDEVKMVLTFFVILFMGYIFTSSSENAEINSIKLQLKQLQSREMQWKKQAAYFEKTLTSVRQELDTLHKYTEKLADEIVDIFLNQLSKPQKSYNLLMKYSKPLTFQLKQLDRHIKKHYKQIGNQNKLRKITHEQVLAYSKEIIPQNDIWHLQIKIQQTQLGMISIGVFTQSKDTECGYCQSDKMFYMYAQNGKIYNGQTLKILKYSLQSRFTSISQGDVVSLFIDIQNQELVWYVNKKYAAIHYLDKSAKEEKLHPFILMTNKGDQVQILKY